MNLYEEARNFIRSLPGVEQKHDPMSAEAYFYGLRNFVHFHEQHHLDIRLSKSDQEQALQTGSWVGVMCSGKRKAANQTSL